MLTKIRNFKAVALEKGQGMVEYGIIIAVVAIISVALFMSEGGSGKGAFGAINTLYDQTGNAINQINVNQGNQTD